MAFNNMGGGALTLPTTLQKQLQQWGNNYQPWSPQFGNEATRDTALGMTWNSDALVDNFIEEYGLPGQTGTMNTPAGEEGIFSMNKMFGNEKTGANGWVSPALNLGFGGFNAWLGNKKLGLAQREMDENTRQFNMNFASNARLTNARLEQQQLSRLRAGRSTESADNYVERVGVQV
jgi:hypothetical protein